MGEVTTEKLVCAHCGENCEDDSLVSEDNIFCCLGCKTVFEILHENGLEAYYKYESQPGISLKHNRGREYFNFLDNEDIKRKILNFESPGISKISLFIPSIHCSSCIWLLENLFKLHHGIDRSEVNFPKKEVHIDFDPQVISLRELIELLASLGYEPEIDLQNGKKELNKTTSVNRSLLIKIGVAGFCFGNIMLLSFPEYLGLERLLENDFSRFFSYIIILFALPVLLYSASGYYHAAFTGLKHKVISIDVPIAIGIFTLFLRSIYEIITHTGPGYFDSLSGLVFFLLIGKWFQNRTYESLLFDRNYKSYFPIAVTRLKENESESVQIEDLKAGDHILIRNGELIPCDATLLSDQAYIDNSFVTGESDPVRKNAGDYIYAGGRQKGNAIELEVQKEVSQSYLTQLWNDKAFQKEAGNDRKILVDRISKYFTLVILGIAILGALFWFYYDPSKVTNVFTAVLIVACPCALALSTPFAVGSAMRILGRNGCYLKNGEIVEELTMIKYVVFDKTGTITYNDKHGSRFVGNLSEKEMQIVSAVASNSYHPLSRKIVKYFKDKVTTEQNLKVTDFDEHPGKGIEARIEGFHLRLGSSEFVRNHADLEKVITSSKVYLSIDNQQKGYFEIRNYYRKGLKENIRELSKEMDLSVLSGDNDSEKKFLESVFPEKAELRFNQSAYDKLEYIRDLQSKGIKVMMVGDGLNDAGALAQANIGIAVTEDVNNFTPASDLILAGKQFKKLPYILRLSSSVVRIILISFIISFLYNIIGIAFAISGNLTPVFAAILMPISSISVVIFTSASVRWKANRLGFR